MTPQTRTPPPPPTPGPPTPPSRRKHHAGNIRRASANRCRRDRRGAADDADHCVPTLSPGDHSIESAITSRLSNPRPKKRRATQIRRSHAFGAHGLAVADAMVLNSIGVPPARECLCLLSIAAANESCRAWFFDPWCCHAVMGAGRYGRR